MHELPDGEEMFWQGGVCHLMYLPNGGTVHGLTSDMHVFANHFSYHLGRDATYAVTFPKTF